MCKSIIAPIPKGTYHRIIIDKSRLQQSERSGTGLIRCHAGQACFKAQ